MYPDIDELREVARLRAQCAELTAERDALWRERMAIIDGLGLDKAMTAGETFERAVLAAAGASADFAAGFNAARTLAADLVRDNKSQDKLDYVTAIRALRGDGA